MSASSTAIRIGNSGLKGWRAKLADRVADPVARRGPLDADQVRALLGAGFLTVSIVYVITAASEALRVLGLAE